jgi:hypothetical protein
MSHQDYTKIPASACYRLFLSSSMARVEHNHESAGRQICTGEKARDLGLPDERIMVIDEGLQPSESFLTAVIGRVFEPA